MAMFGVIPGEKLTAKHPAVLDRAEASRKLRTVFQGLELAFRKRVIIGDMGAAVGFSHPQIRQHKRHGLGLHGRSPVGMDRELSGDDTLFLTGGRDQSFSQGAAGTGTTLDCGQKTRGGAAYLPGRAPDLLSRELGVELYRLEKWRDAALTGMEEALKARNGDPLKAELDTAMQRIGELTMENELLWVRVRCPGPLAKRRSKK